MNLSKVQSAVESAARAAGQVIYKNLRVAKKVNSETSHDIKLELDVRCQALIQNKLHRVFPEVALLGEEGVSGSDNAEYRWVVDPIDGTVNFAHGIPHASVSIALQRQGAIRASDKSRNGGLAEDASFTTVLGVIYDPFTDELWTAIRGQTARLNGSPVRVSKVRKLSGSIASVGFAKNRTNLERAIPYFVWLARRVQKIRMMGSAALALAYVATGRFDVYVERGISLWDIAAGGLLVECAGGKFWQEPIAGKHKFRMVASNGLLQRLVPKPR